MKSFLATVGFCTAAAILYGLIHDQITIRICPEYFTEFHPRVTDSTDITVIALIWGVIATWWVGAILGALVWAASNLGRRWPPRSLRQTVKGCTVLFLCAGLAATLVGLLIAQSGLVVPDFVMGPRYVRLPEELKRRLTIDLAIHNTSYLAAFFGGVILIALSFLSRLRQPPGSPQSGV